MVYTVEMDNPIKLTLNETDPVKSILQGVFIILSTWQGSIPLARGFGLSSEYVDKPPPAAQAMLVAAVTEAISEYEPRAKVAEIIFSGDQKNPGKLITAVKVEIADG